MNCPRCAYENKDDALVCNLCSEILRREKPRPAPMGVVMPPAQPPAAAPAAPAEPAISAGNTLGRNPKFWWMPFMWGALLLLWGTSLLVQRSRLVSFPPYPKDVPRSELLDQPGYAYVRFDRNELRKEASFFRVVDTKGVSFAELDPRVGFTASSPNELITRAKAFMGNYVKLTHAPPVMESWTLTTKRVHYSAKYREKVSEETLGHRIYAPVLGTNGKLWIVSKWYQQEPKTEVFLTQTERGGILKSLREDKEWGQIAAAYRNATHQQLSENALVLIDDPPPTTTAATLWVPLGTANDVFVEVPEDGDLDQSYAEGILDQPIEKYEWSQLGTYLQAQKRGSPPPKVRVLVQMTPVEFAAMKDLPPKVHRFGVLVLATGIFILAWGFVRAKRLLHF